MAAHSPYSHMLHDLHGALEAMDGVKDVLGLTTDLKVKGFLMPPPLSCPVLQCVVV